MYIYILCTVNDGESNAIDIIGDRKYLITSSKNLLPVVEKLIDVSHVRLLNFKTRLLS